MREMIKEECEMRIVANDSESIVRKHLSGFAQIEFIGSESKKNKISASSKNLFLISNSLGVNDLAPLIHSANNKHQLKALLIREEQNQNWITRILDMADLRTLRNLLVFSNWVVPKRILTAWRYGVQDKLIADAAVFDDQLYVQDCALNTIVVPFASIKALSRIPKNKRREFSISEEGAIIEWAEFDTQFDLEILQITLNPELGNKYLLQKIAHDELFGKAIANIRYKKNLGQRDILGLSERQVRRIENGESASLKCLEALAQAHQLPLKEYLNLLANETQKIRTQKA